MVIATSAGRRVEILVEEQGSGPSAKKLRPRTHRIGKLSKGSALARAVAGHLVISARLGRKGCWWAKGKSLFVDNGTPALPAKEVETRQQLLSLHFSLHKHNFPTSSSHLDNSRRPGISLVPLPSTARFLAGNCSKFTFSLSEPTLSTTISTGQDGLRPQHHGGRVRDGLLSNRRSSSGGSPPLSIPAGTLPDPALHLSDHTVHLLCGHLGLCVVLVGGAEGLQEEDLQKVVGLVGGVGGRDVRGSGFRVHPQAFG